MGEKWRNYFEAENLSWWVGVGWHCLHCFPRHPATSVAIHSSRDISLWFLFDFSLYFVCFLFVLKYTALSQPGIHHLPLLSIATVLLTFPFYPLLTLFALLSFPLHGWIYHIWSFAIAPTIFSWFSWLSHPLTAMLVSVHYYFYCNKLEERDPNTGMMVELFGATRSMKKNKVSHSEMLFRV